MSKKTPGRDERLAAALKANLRRRKQAQQGRAKAPKPDAGEPPVGSLKLAKKPG